MSFWGKACNNSMAKSPETLINEASVYGGFVVASSIICAAASGVMFFKWWILSDEHRLRIWKLYGWFTALMCAGSVILSLCISAWIGFLVNFYSSDTYGAQNLSDARRSDVGSSLARAYRWLIVYVLLSPLTLGCLLISKLLVIHRFASFLDPRLQRTPRRVISVGRALLGVVAVGSFVGFCCNVAAAVYFARSSALYEGAASGPPEAYNGTSNAAISQVSIGLDLAAVFLAFEALCLLLIVVVLAAVGLLGARSLNAALNAVESQRVLAFGVSLKTNATGFDQSADRQLQRAVSISRRLKRQILGTVGVVLISFVLRAGITSMFMMANAFQNSGDACEKYVGRCSECYNDFSQMLIWFLHTPSFQLTVALISQPVALIVSLWGMTSGHTLDMMRKHKRGPREVCEIPT